MAIAGHICKLIQLICLISMFLVTYGFKYESLFRCQDTGKYISHNYFCDGYFDCENEEDEINGCNKSMNCEQSGYKKYKRYVCDQQCKDLKIRCNGIRDCEDGIDELNCGDGIDVKNCTSESKFLCKDGLRCIELYNTCDDECNCFDCSDEDNKCEERDHSSIISEPSPNETLKTDTDRNNETSSTSISLPTTKSTGLAEYGDEYFTAFRSDQIVTIPEEESKNKESRNTKTKSYKSVVELMASHTYNNSFVLTNMLNFSRDKHDISLIGEPINLTGLVENLVFEDKMSPYYSIHSIHASGFPSADSDHTYQKNFTCWSQYCDISSHIIPEITVFEGNYIVSDPDRNESCNGTFVSRQIDPYLEYQIHSTGYYPKQDTEINSRVAKMTLDPDCGDKGQLLFLLSLLCGDIESRMVKNLDASVKSSFITKSVDQFITFPFLYKIFASSMNEFSYPLPFLYDVFATPSTPQRMKSLNYYVIEETVIIGKNTSTPLQLGPMIIKGLDNFDYGDVVATKGRLLESPNYFNLRMGANPIQGQCDWRLLKGDTPHAAINHSFTFVIETARFEVGVDFSESWNVDYLDINIRLKDISIHRLNRIFPKTLDLMRINLKDFIQSMVKNSLIKLFNQHFPKLATLTASITTDTPNEKTKTIATRQPLPTRRVFISCKDTRNWWQKLFYKNKCEEKVGKDDSVS